jgi:zinc protease
MMAVCEPGAGRTSTFVIALSLLLGGCAATRSRPEAPARKAAVKLELLHFAAGNGLQVVVIPDPSANDVRVTMRYRVGAIHDPKGREGMAHLVEHLMFLHTYEASTLYERIDAATTYSNAFTEIDTTTYVARGPAANLDDIVEIEGIRLGLGCTSISDDAFAREREIVLNELRQRSDGIAINKALTDGLYPADHPYRRAIGGSEASVAAITRDEACAFVQTHYAPNNAVLVVSGNVTDAAVDGALSKLLGRVPKRSVPSARAVAPAAVAARTDKTAPVDEPTIVIAWPLPADPAERARIRAVASMTRNRINYHVKGAVSRGSTFGGDRAQWLTIEIDPAFDESIDEALAGARKGADGLAQWLERESFESAKQYALHDVFESLETGFERDAAIADHVLAGRAPSKEVGEHIAAVSKLTRDAAREIARDVLSFDRAAIVTLTPTASRPAIPVAVGAPIHSGDRRPPQVQKERADKPAPRRFATHPLAAATKRTLSNGLDVILVPTSRVPTVDIRLVFPAGTGDDPRGRRGIAILAARALEWADSDWHEVDGFYLGGGSLSAWADVDHTVFGTVGVDMHVDLLLTGLERLIRNGRYTATIGEVVARWRQAQTKVSRTDEEMLRKWRTAIYGADHPYVDAGLSSTISSDLTAGDLSGFRDRHYQPDGATLIITGGFDPAVANRWIDFLFGDWKGSVSATARARPDVTPSTIPVADGKTSQLEVWLGLPATGSSTAAARAAEMVVADMVGIVLAEIREGLAASYGLSAALDEHRQVATYVISGFVDGRRAREVIELLSSRMDQLRKGGDAIAPIFIAARRRVLDAQFTTANRASALADRLTRSIALGRGLGSELALADAIADLTLADITPTLSKLDLVDAAMLLRGPEDAIAAATAGRD